MVAGHAPPGEFRSRGETLGARIFHAAEHACGEVDGVAERTGRTEEGGQRGSMVDGRVGGPAHGVE